VYDARTANGVRMSQEAYNEIMDPEKGQWYRSRHKEMDYEAVVGNTRDPEGNILSNSNFPDMKGTLEVFDIWRQQAVGTRKEGVSVKMSPNGVAMLLIK